MLLCILALLTCSRSDHELKADEKGDCKQKGASKGREAGSRCPRSTSADALKPICNLLLTGKGSNSDKEMVVEESEPVMGHREHTDDNATTDYEAPRKKKARRRG